MKDLTFHYPIVTAEEMRLLDRQAIDGLGIPSNILMENAGRAVSEVIIRQLSGQSHSRVIVVVGSGNNGGDGYVVARELSTRGISVQVFALKKSTQSSDEALFFAELWKRFGGVAHDLTTPAEFDDFKQALAQSHVVVDAIFGTGFRGEPDEFVSRVIQAINDKDLRRRELSVVSIDIPSGVDASTGAIATQAIRATDTVVIQALKVGTVFHPGTEYHGRVWLADIGIPVPGSLSLSPQRFFAHHVDISNLFQQLYPKHASAHKGTHGRALVIGGSAGFYGAPKMSGEAALVAGAGLVSIALPESGAKSIAPELKELMCISCEDEQGAFSSKAAKDFKEISMKHDALVLGPGLGQSGGALEIARGVLEVAREKKIPLVIDADAIHLIAKNESLRELLGPHAVLTPHPGEMASLCGNSVADVQANRFESAMNISLKYKVNVVLKGARTVVASSDGLLFCNPASTEVLGTAGSGDVLAGVIGGLCARGFSSIEAAVCGVFVHGCSGEILAQSGIAGHIASDILKVLPPVMNELLSEPVFTESLLQQVF